MVTKVIKVAEYVLKRIVRLVGKKKSESWSDVMHKMAYAKHPTYK